MKSIFEQLKPNFEVHLESEEVVNDAPEVKIYVSAVNENLEPGFLFHTHSAVRFGAKC